jgi:hypothetical protein
MAISMRPKASLMQCSARTLLVHRDENPLSSNSDDGFRRVAARAILGIGEHACGIFGAWRGPCWPVADQPRRSTETARRARRAPSAIRVRRALAWAPVPARGKRHASRVGPGALGRGQHSRLGRHLRSPMCMFIGNRIRGERSREFRDHFRSLTRVSWRGLVAGGLPGLLRPFPTDR